MAVRDVNAAGEENEAPEDDEASSSMEQQAMPDPTSPKVPEMNEADKLQDTGKKMPDIPGVERIIMVDGISGDDGVKVDALENATKDSNVPVLKKPACGLAAHTNLI